MSTISQEESLLLQCLATTSLLGELSNANFLESDYYKQLSFSNKNREEGADKILDYYRASKGAFLCIQKNKKILHYGYIIKQSL